MPKVPVSREEKIKCLLAQYHECVENYRALDKHVWQVPATTVVISSGIIGVTFEYLKNNITATLIILTIGVSLSLSMYIAIKKYRFFQKYNIDLMRKIENDLGMYNIPLVTGKYGMIPNSWSEKQKAGNWLANSILIVSAIMIVLIIYNLLRLILGKTF